MTRAIAARDMLEPEEVRLIPAHLPLPAVLSQLATGMCASAELASRGRELFAAPPSTRLLLARLLTCARVSPTAEQRTAVISSLATLFIASVSVIGRL